MQRLIYALIALALAACGGGDPEDNTPDKTIDPPACGASGVCA